MASTLLAVDDSLTMRKVLEITFASPDFNIVTASSPDAALQKIKADKPDLVITDGTLEPKNGYELCKEIKRLFPTTPVLFLSSKQNPFDAAKGTASLVDDHMDKPFDTQQMIDKVKKLLSGQGAGVAKPGLASQTTPSMISPIEKAQVTTTKPTVANIAPAANAAAAAPAPGPMQRAKTLIYNPPAPTGGAPAPEAKPAPTQSATRPITAVSPAMPRPTANPNVTVTGQTGEDAKVAVVHAAPAPKPAVEAKAPTVDAKAPTIEAHVNGQLNGKLEQLGLTPAQVEAVTALSREVIERVVWEIVPVLAETLIKEELARLTK